MRNKKWLRLLAYVTGSVNQKLLMHNEYLAAETSDQVVRFLDNPEVRDFVTSLMRNQVYTRIQQDAKSRISEA